MDSGNIKEAMKLGPKYKM